MKSYRLTGTSLDHLNCREEDAPPPPAAGEVQVDMKAAALNYRDIGVVTGAV
jgi:NADPH:quinone reductase-like Zn-dependent oxidoreductase